MRPDAKVQVTVEYKKEGHLITPLRIATILISCQHDDNVSNETIRADLEKIVIEHAIPAKWLQKTQFVLNPSGRFVIGGPTGDAGLTGRKIIADTYGGWGGHGGGAFSGKDSSKVDRSAAYAARWIAKSLVAGGFAKRCMVQIAYSIGLSKPLSVFVDSYDTVAENYTDHDLSGIVTRNFDLRPGAIIRDLKLKRPIFKQTSHGCHFGRHGDAFTW